MEGYLSFTKLFKVILYNYFILEISFFYINNQVYINQLVNIINYLLLTILITSLNS